MTVEKEATGGASGSHNMQNYAETYAAYQAEVPEYYNFAYDLVDTYAEDPNREMMYWVQDGGGERRLTYAYFRDRSNQVGRALLKRGLKKGDNVFILMPRLPEWWESMLGMMKAGIVGLPGTTQLTPKDILFRLHNSQAKAIITDVENAAKFDEALKSYPDLHIKLVVGGEREGWTNYEEAVSAESSDPARLSNTKSTDPLLLYFTSGTTGNPKMVLHTHSSYPIGHISTGRYWLDLQPGDLHWNLADTGWAKAAWSSFFGPLIMGVSIFVHNTTARYTAPYTLNLLQQYGVTSFCAPPTIYRMLIAEDLKKYDLSKLRSCVGAGEPLNAEAIEVWQRETGLTIRDGYGQTETCLVCGNFPTSDMVVKPGSMGKPAPGYVLDVIDDEGHPLPPNKEGDIAIQIHPKRPVGLFQEYWNNPGATSASMRGDYYVTGDRAYKDEDGYFWFVGRSDDVIISAGYRIGPFEVESALVEHPAVLESAVVAKPDEVRGEIVKAFIILKPGYEGSPELVKEIQGFVQKITAPYKYPREIEFVTELPKTVSGKIRRVELRQREAKK
ncbi:MAG: acyl-CoA synthetase [Chloroflexi bacterium 54-19]|nr:MAG: acyl-CoA synthetase [Chloroflexi bacterium 54-19]